MTERRSNGGSSKLKVNPNCSPEREINILLLGQTGVGKTTLINALANHLTYDTLDEALQAKLQVIIPSTITYTDPETFDSKMIKVGNGKEVDETTIDNGQSCTRYCRSFVFPLGDRNLRFIDTPGMGDTRGSEQDNTNLFEILTYISHYEHLNAICILLKPNEERLTVAFRLCIRQILHYLQGNAAENLIFIFTNARTTFFSPGSSKKNLELLLKEYNEKHEFEILFSKENTFLVDNEPFRYLALNTENIVANKEETQVNIESWNHTKNQYERLLTYMSKCSLHAVGTVLSINGAEQLIKRTARPIAETLRHILRSIHLANKLKLDLNKESRIKKRPIPLIVVQINPLHRPRLVCISDKCTHVSNDGNETRIDSARPCQENCYLDGVTQEAINDPRIAKCEVMNSDTGICNKCNCDWKEHINITYEYHTFQPGDANGGKHNKNDKQSLLNDIEKHIEDLQGESEKIEEVYMKLLEFLLVHAICRPNDDFSKYLEIFIKKEEMKKGAHDSNDDIIANLNKILKQYEEKMKILKENITRKESSTEPTKTIQSDKVFTMVGTLYRLPINGQKIREQINALTIMEDRAVKTREICIELPESAASSHIMSKFEPTKTSTKLETRF